MWSDHNTVVTPENLKISGATVNEIGKTVHGQKYIDIFLNCPKYVTWAISTAPPESEGSVELKHMASFFLAARQCQEEFDPPSSSPPSSSTTQPRGKSSFKKSAAAPKKETKQPEAFNMAISSDEEEFW